MELPVGGHAEAVEVAEEQAGDDAALADANTLKRVNTQPITEIADLPGVIY